MNLKNKANMIYLPALPEIKEFFALTIKIFFLMHGFINIINRTEFYFSRLIKQNWNTHYINLYFTYRISMKQAYMCIVSYIIYYNI